MLKIKGDVELQELEKFGFKREIVSEELGIISEMLLKIDDIEVTIEEGSRILYIFGYEEKCISNNQLCIDEGLTPIYDLIQAGLVEKVDEK